MQHIHCYIYIYAELYIYRYARMGVHIDSHVQLGACRWALTYIYIYKEMDIYVYLHSCIPTYIPVYIETCKQHWFILLDIASGRFSSGHGAGLHTQGRTVLAGWCAGFLVSAFLFKICWEGLKMRKSSKNGWTYWNHLKIRIHQSQKNDEIYWSHLKSVNFGESIATPMTWLLQNSQKSRTTISQHIQPDIAGDVNILLWNLFIDSAMCLGWMLAFRNKQIRK